MGVRENIVERHGRAIRGRLCPLWARLSSLVQFKTTGTRVSVRVCVAMDLTEEEVNTTHRSFIGIAIYDDCMAADGTGASTAIGHGVNTGLSRRLDKPEAASGSRRV